MSLKLFIENEIDWIKPFLEYIPHISSTLEDCDYIVSCTIPYGCTNPQHIQDVLLSYENSNKKVIVFLLSDYNEPFIVPSNVYFFRSGMYKSQQKSNEYLIPYIWVKQELKGDYEFHPLPKRIIRPLIGFCGSVSSHPCRISHMNQIKRNQNIKTNFILRTQYWGGKPYDSKIVQDFVKNILESHFTLCSRGAGNWSARFYQVLSLGRIPVVVNTDMVLPLENIIDWKNSIVLCHSEHELSNAILHFWNTKDIVEAQKECKQIYDEYLSPQKWCERMTTDILLTINLINVFL